MACFSTDGGKSIYKLDVIHVAKRHWPGYNDHLNHIQRYTDGHDCLLMQTWGHLEKIYNQTQLRDLDPQAEK